MKRTVLIFGVISGLISSLMMLITLTLVNRGSVNFDNGEVLGYTTIFLSFLLVFFGIRSYRENNGGTISFGRAFAVGILITLISCAFYVGTWELIYIKFMPDFGEKWAAAEIAKLRTKGASDAAIAAKKKEMDDFQVMYKNPLMNTAMTFMEPFPVGLIVTLVSAGILRKRNGTPALAGRATG
jgi:Protein of unknown function (DUF4199)